MAQQTSIAFLDDLDGSKAVETVRFGLDGTSYEIDLSKENAAGLRKAIAVYVDSGRRIRSTSSPSKRSARTASSAGDSAAIREWAQTRGITVSTRGRIAADIRQRYEAAHS